MKDQTFITVAEVAEMMGISKSYAYKIVHKLNENLKAMGYLTIAGRVNRSYFLEKTCYSPAFPDIRRTDRLMPVYKEEKTNTWRVIYRYTDWKGERKQTSKRGFSTKREAQAWEREQLNKVTADVDMTFASFIDRYTEDMKTRLKENTWSTKEHIIRSKLIPYFGRLKLSNITPQQIITWQNELLNYRDAQGKPYSPVYLRTIQNQLSAIFNHAVRYYRLRENPCKKAGSMGKKKAREMLFWTKEEYLQFAKAIQDKPMAYHAFQMLYWCGIREGELLALTPADFDFDRETVTISKSYQRLKGKDVITDPKTEKSNRTITMPDFLAAEMQEYIGSLYRIQSDDRIFPFTSSFLRHEMERGCKASGVKKIRIHDLRHSAISLLIDMGFSPLAIADRVGHEAIEITYNYAHLFPSKQQDMAKQLSQAMHEAPEPPDKPPHASQLTLIKNDSAA